MNSDLKKAIEDCSSAVDEKIKLIIPESAPGILRESIEYHLETGGKRMRPALCVITCQALGGRREDALDFAAAVELLHNMFLVHDDVEDGDEVRRDKTTVWVKYGVPHAINSGDYLLGLAFNSVMNTPGDTALRVRLMEVFNTAYMLTVEGQAMDISSRADAEFSMERYLKTVELKTGYYLALGMVGGAIIAGADCDAVEGLWRFGCFAGPAFQVRDDVLDLSPNKGRGGKIGSDIEEGKASILYAHALQNAQPADRDKLILIMQKPREKTSPDDVAWVVALFERCGSIDFAQSFSRDMLAKAMEEIRELPLIEGELLTGMANLLVERSK